MDFLTAYMMNTQAAQAAATRNDANRRLDAEMDEKRRIQERADNERKTAEEKETTRKASGAAGFGGLRSGVEAQLRQGLITYNDAVSQLRGHGAKFELDPEEAVSNLTNVYTKELLPGRQATSIAAAYEDLLQRPATEEEKKTATTRFEQGYYTSVQDLKDTILKGSDYQDKFQTSYLGNYYDTMYGKEERDTEGKRTGKRAFKFDSSLLPTYAAGTEGKTGVSIPKFGDDSLTIGGIENREKSISDTRKYLYSAGLTNLQGDIDKETQKLKNEGAKDVAKIGSAGDIYKSLVGSFSF